MTARLHVKNGDKVVVELPDGRLGIPSALIPANRGFQRMTADEIEQALHAGECKDFQLLKTQHYLVFYQTSPEFARDAGKLLEDLYRGLYDAFKNCGFPVHDAETPLIAIAYKDEKDYRKNNRVDPQVQACYEIYSNRIFFYQHSEREKLEPELTRILKPQTVAHEGVHQILANIGVQPRLSPWPLWLVEGLAEYCGTTNRAKKGTYWPGTGAINSAHMATLRELGDPISLNLGDYPQEKDPTPLRYGDRARVLITKTRLNATDYAHAWAMTHYLASKRQVEFVNFLKAMSQIPPLATRTPEDHLALFRKFFGQDLARLDKKIDEAIQKLSTKKGYDRLPYYAVMVEQPLGNGAIRRLALVSQSPQIIRQWVTAKLNDNGGNTSWQAIPMPTRARAAVLANQWVNGQ